MLLPLWTVCFAAGIAVGLGGPRGLAVGLAAASTVAALLLLRRGRPVLGVGCGLLAAGLTAGAIAARPPAMDPALARVARGAAVPIEARWLRPLRAEPSAQLPARALLALERAGGQPVSGRLALSIARGPIGFRPGDRVRLHARLSVPRGLHNPGRPDPALALQTQGIDVIAFVRRASEITLVAEGPALSPRRMAADAHAALAAAIDRRVDPARAAFLRAIVLGERDAGGPQVEAGFKAAGAVHALSVSGLHLTAVAALAFLLLRRALSLWPRLALRLRTEALAAVLALVLVVFYTLVTGEAVATRRSALMAALGLGAVVLRRFPALPSAIACAALVMLAASPPLLLDASFQLSFASVIALALLSAHWSAEAPPGRWWSRARRWLARGLMVSLAAFVATAPLCTHHFAELTPAAPIGNLLIVPIVELGIVPMGLAGAALGALWDPLGYLPLHAASALSAAALWLAEGFRRWAPVWLVWSPNGFEATCLTLAALLGLPAISRATGPGFRRRLAVAALLLAFLGGGSLGARALARRLDRGVTVTFLDVGQGDAALIEGPRGQVVLVDGGGAGELDGRFDPGARVIEPVLRRKTIGAVDLVVLSHPHPDHMNGLHRVLERFAVKKMWVSGDDGRNPAYARLLALARERGTAIERPRSGPVGGLTMQLLHPFVGEQIGPPPGLSVNDASLVVRLGFGGRSVLFTGDIEEQGEAELVASAAQLGGIRSDVLKVPHHASRTSSSADLLAAVAPALAVASLAAGNRYGFPHPEVLARYQERSLRLLRTDRDGAVSVRIEPNGDSHVTCVRGCR